ncbi:MAG: type II toxin-antitoxin system RelE/ParE family toxin [Gammaproteobacteria bacterium]|nr:type II toxin-antitoxin system RelE/ParE family toxin [Gammaproteobacteria bacterium]
MIKTFRHRGLKEIYERGHSSKVAQSHVTKIMRILTVLDQSLSPTGMDIPGFRLHPLKGRMKGYYSVSVSANWRVVFRFEEGHALDVDYLDYH